MKKIKYIIIIILITIFFGGFLIFKKEGNEDMHIKLLINNEKLDVSLVDNSTTRKLRDILKEQDIIIKAQDYGNFEKVGEINFELPTNDQKITTSYGDIVLYNGTLVSLFYNSNTWEYTRIGHIDNITQQELINILGDGDKELHFSID